MSVNFNKYLLNIFTLNCVRNYMLYSLCYSHVKFWKISKRFEGSSWSWSYGSWSFNYLCLLPLTLWVRIPLMRGVLDTTLCDKVCQWLSTGWWFSLGIPVSSTNKTNHHDITDILLKVALNIINQTFIYS
jgi:hypothetical protein